MMVNDQQPVIMANGCCYWEHPPGRGCVAAGGIVIIGQEVACSASDGPQQDDMILP